MSHKLTLLLALSIILFFSWRLYESKQSPIDKAIIELPSEPEEEEMSGAGKSLDAWSLSRSYPSEKVKPHKFSQAHQIKKNLTPTSASQQSNWEPLGPQNFAGRILTIALDPNNTNTLYAGAASGGLWKSINDGGTWEYVPTNMPVLGVSSIVINPDNSDEMLIGTGEVYGDFDINDNIPNQGTGQGYTIRYRRGTYGIGILKTTDGGQTWDYSLDWSEESELKGVNCIKMSPFNPNILYAGTSHGLLRSTDLGSTWTTIMDAPNVMNIAMHPTIDGTMLVGVGTFESDSRGVYRSTDGINFIQVGLPDFSGKAMLDFSVSDPNIAFASIGNYDESVGLFRSEDGGINWSLVNDYDYAKYQGWYAHDVAINPNNSSTVLVGGINVYRSTNNGGTLIPESDWLLWNLSAFPIEGPEQPAGDFIHADIHDILYHPTIPNKIYVASDGGVFKSENDGLDFISANTGLQTVQFYQNFSSSMTDENFALGGLQDNATTIYRGNLAWERKIGGDGFGTLIDPNDDRNVWGSLYYMRLFYSKNKGVNFISNSGNLPGCVGVDPACFCNFSAPICFAPSSTNLRIYGASNIVYRIENGSDRIETNNGNPLDGNNPVNCLAASPTNEDLVYAGTAPLYSNQAKMFKSENGGDSWTNVTNGLPDRFPMDIKVDPCDDEKVYVTFGGYDLTSHVYRTEDGGGLWFPIGTDLPDIPTNTILIDPENTDHIYIGNDIGVFVSTDGGTTFSSYSTGLPDACLVMSLSFTPVNRKLRIATHGNGAYQASLLHTQEPYIAKADELGEWYQNDFEVNFADEPNACIFQQCFYTVRDYDGNDWRGNPTRGFISDDFDQTTLNNEWNATTGTWSVQNEILEQTNTVSQNTQLDISLNQTDTTSFLYHWRMKFDGNGNEKRAGVHIFADDLSKPDRGNSYLIYFWENSDVVRIYKTDGNDNYDLVLTESATISNNEWLDCKVTYEPNIGRVSVYLNNEKVAYIYDDNPLLSGNGFSLRTADAMVAFDDINVYKGRDCSGGENIVVATDGDCRFESQNDDTYVCGIQSVGFSIMRNWSTPNESKVKIGEHDLTLAGNISTEDIEEVEDVNILLQTTSNQSTLTDNLGNYQFNVMSGETIDIIPEKLDDIKNGVNTFDLVLLQQHILGLNPITSPYNLVAGDVNKSGEITTFDIIKIKLVILEFETQFTNNTSWRFVPADYVFSAPYDLINFPNKISIPQMTSDRMDANFTAIKIGDVNSSAALFAPNQQADTRTNQYLNFVLENKKLKTGDEVTIPFIVKDFNDITGYQMSLDFDASALDFVEAIPNAMSDLPKEDFGISKIEEGKILMNWVAGNAIDLADQTELFSFVFKIKKDIQLSEAIKLSDIGLRTEAYNEANDFLRIQLEYNQEVELVENTISNIAFSPNPFSNNLTLSLESKKSEQGEIIFYDEVGRVLKSQTLDLQKGENQIGFNFSNEKYSGLIFYKLKTESGEGVGKLLRL